MPTRQRRAKAVLKKALANLAPSYTLYYVTRGDDGLHEEQIADIFDGNVEKVEEVLDDYADDGIDYYLTEIVKELIPDEDERDLLEEFVELHDELRFAIRDRDDSKGPLLEQLGVTGAKLMRYELNYHLEPGSWSWEEDEVQKAMAEMAEVMQVDLEANRGSLWSLVAEASYGGQLYVIWYGDVEEVVMPILNKLWGNDDKVPTTIAWTDPEVVVLNAGNGSGYSDTIKGTITVPFDPEKLAMDGRVRGHGYTWDDVAGVAHSAFRCDVTLT